MHLPAHELEEVGPVLGSEVLKLTYILVGEDLEQVEQVVLRSVVLILQNADSAIGQILVAFLFFEHREARWRSIPLLRLLLLGFLDLSVSLVVFIWSLPLLQTTSIVVFNLNGFFARTGLFLSSRGSFCG